MSVILEIGTINVGGRQTRSFQQMVAAFTALPADLGTNPARLEPRGMEHAFLGTKLTGDDAGLQLRTHQEIGRVGLTGE